MEEHLLLRVPDELKDRLKALVQKAEAGDADGGEYLVCWRSCLKSFGLSVHSRRTC